MQLLFNLLPSTFCINPPVLHTSPIHPFSSYLLFFHPPFLQRTRTSWSFLPLSSIVQFFPPLFSIVLPVLPSYSSSSYLRFFPLTLLHHTYGSSLLLFFIILTVLPSYSSPSYFQFFPLTLLHRTSGSSLLLFSIALPDLPYHSSSSYCTSGSSLPLFFIVLPDLPSHSSPLLCDVMVFDCVQARPWCTFVTLAPRTAASSTGSSTSASCRRSVKTTH